MNFDFVYSKWETPDGDITAKVYDRYDGLRGQRRIALVDRMGRVYHYDENQVKQKQE
jgi:hypothetical protein